MLCNHLLLQLFTKPQIVQKCSLLSYRVIFELLWRDYFRFVSVKYGNRIFQVKGKMSSSVDLIFFISN